LTELENPETPLATRKLNEILHLPLVRAELPHDAPATFVAFSPDGSRIVTIAGHRAVRIWNTGTGRPLTKPLIHDDVVTVAAVSPDNGTLLTIAGNAVHVWDIASGTVRHTWSYDGPVAVAGFLARGKRVAIAVGPAVW